MNKRICDMYFLNPNEAYKTAILRNTYGTFNDLQICYYDGEKFDNTPENMINVPIGEIYDFFSERGLRIPTAVSHEGMNLNIETKKEIESYILTALKSSNIKRSGMIDIYKKEIKNIKLDFREPLRIFFITTRLTSVMQYAVKNVSSAFEKLGYTTFISVEHNDMMSWGQNEDSGYFAWHLKNMLDFKPHITLNINYMHNSFLPKDMFNFIWFQDPVPILTNNEKIKLRKRDYIFTAQPLFDKYLKKAGVPKTRFSGQHLGYNSSRMFIDENIKRENKIIFIGSYYDANQRFNKVDIYNDICLLFDKGISLTKKNIKKICKKHNVEYTDESLNLLQQCVIRNKVVEWLCDSGLENIEIYGYLWDKSPSNSIKRFYKGQVAHEKVKDLYNSAKYVLVVSGQVINTQRLAECTACGAIPVIFDSRDISPEKETWDDECLYFKSKKKLKKILQKKKEPKGDISKIAKFLSYEHFAEKILKNIKEEINNENT